MTRSRPFVLATLWVSVVVPTACPDPGGGDDDDAAGDDDDDAVDPALAECRQETHCASGAFTLDTVSEDAPALPQTGAFDPLIGQEIRYYVALGAASATFWDVPAEDLLRSSHAMEVQWTQLHGGPEDPVRTRMEPWFADGTALIVLDTTGGEPSLFAYSQGGFSEGGDPESFTFELTCGAVAVPLDADGYAELAPMVSDCVAWLRRFDPQQGNGLSDLATGPGTFSFD